MSESITKLGELIHWAELKAEDFQYWEDAEEIRRFGKTWRDFQNIHLEDVSINQTENKSKGHWILDIDNDYPVMMRPGWRCSNCGRRETYGTTPYCPYCGSKMEVKK